MESAAAFDGGFDRRLPGEHNHFGRILRFFAQAAQQSDAVKPRHIDIAQQDIEIFVFERFPSRFAVGSRKRRGSRLGARTLVSCAANGGCCFAPASRRSPSSAA